MDAAALVSIQQMIKASDQRGSALIRFYTETPALHRAWRDNQRLRERLSHASPKKLSAADADTIAGIFRTADYFLMRLRFPELVPGSKVSSPLDRLQGLLRSIEETDRMSDAELQRAVSLIEFDGQSLEQMIDEFEALSLMRALWKRVPHQLLESRHLDEVLKDFRKVFDFVVKNAGELGEKIDHIREGLGGQLSQVAQWGVDFKALRAASERLRSKIQDRRLKPIENPLRDLGLVRWGLSMPEPDMAWIAKSIEALTSASDSELDVQCFNLANELASARRKLEDCMKVAALLWALEMYDQTAQLIEDFRSRSTKDTGRPYGLPRGLNLLRVAAYLRGGGGLQSLEKALSEIRRERASLRGEDRGIYDLGLGYVLYFAWRQENQGSGTSPRGRGAVDKRAQECFDLGLEAIDLLSRNGNKLALVYAVNHCAYIATITNLDIDAFPWVEKLLGFKVSPDIWHARFDDTIGMYYVQKARRRLAERDLTGAEESAQRAKDYLTVAKANDTGGIEIDVHMAKLDEVHDAVWDYRRRPPRRGGRRRPPTGARRSGA